MKIDQGSTKHVGGSRLVNRSAQEDEQSYHELIHQLEIHERESDQQSKWYIHEIKQRKCAITKLSGEIKQYENTLSSIRCQLRDNTTANARGRARSLRLNKMNSQVVEALGADVDVLHGSIRSLIDHKLQEKKNQLEYIKHCKAPLYPVLDASVRSVKVARGHLLDKELNDRSLQVRADIENTSKTIHQKSDLVDRTVALVDEYRLELSIAAKERELWDGIVAKYRANIEDAKWKVNDLSQQSAVAVELALRDWTSERTHVEYQNKVRCILEKIEPAEAAYAMAELKLKQLQSKLSDKDEFNSAALNTILARLDHYRQEQSHFSSIIHNSSIATDNDSCLAIHNRLVDNATECNKGSDTQALDKACTLSTSGSDTAPTMTGAVHSDIAKELRCMYESKHNVLERLYQETCDNIRSLELALHEIHSSDREPSHVSVLVEVNRREIHSLSMQRDELEERLLTLQTNWPPAEEQPTTLKLGDNNLEAVLSGSKVLESSVFQGDLLQLQKALEQEVKDLECESLHVAEQHQSDASLIKETMKPLQVEVEVLRSKLASWYEELVDLRSKERSRLSEQNKSQKSSLIQIAESTQSCDVFSVASDVGEYCSSDNDEEHRLSQEVYRARQITTQWEDLQRIRLTAKRVFHQLSKLQLKLKLASESHELACQKENTTSAKLIEENAKLEALKSALVKEENSHFSSLVSLKDMIVRQVALFFNEAQIQRASIQDELDTLTELENKEKKLRDEISVLEQQQLQCNELQTYEAETLSGELSGEDEEDDDADEVVLRLNNMIESTETNLLSLNVQLKEEEELLREIVQQANERLEADKAWSYQLEQKLKDKVEVKALHIPETRIPTTFPRIRCLQTYHPQEVFALRQIIKFLQGSFSCEMRTNHGGWRTNCIVSLSKDVSRIEIRFSSSGKDFIKLQHLEQVDERWEKCQLESKPSHTSFPPDQLRDNYSRSSDSAASSNSSLREGSIGGYSSPSSVSIGGLGDDELDEETKEEPLPPRQIAPRTQTLTKPSAQRKLLTVNEHPNHRSPNNQFESDDSSSERARGRARSNVEESCVTRKNMSLHPRAVVGSKTPTLRIKARGGRCFTWRITNSSLEESINVHTCWVRGLMLLAHHSQDKQTGIESLRSIMWSSDNRCEN